MFGISTDTSKSSVNFSPKINMKVKLSSSSVSPALPAQFQLGEWKAKCFSKGPLYFVPQEAHVWYKTRPPQEKKPKNTHNSRMCMKGFRKYYAPNNNNRKYSIKTTDLLINHQVWFSLEQNSCIRKMGREFSCLQKVEVPGGRRREGAAALKREACTRKRKIKKTVSVMQTFSRRREIKRELVWTGEKRRRVRIRTDVSYENHSLLWRSGVRWLPADSVRTDSSTIRVLPSHTTVGLFSLINNRHLFFIIFSFFDLSLDVSCSFSPG